MRTLLLISFASVACASESPMEADAALPVPSVVTPRADSPAPDASVAERGTRDAEVASALCPDEMVRVAGFCVDRYEAHLRSPDGAVHPHHRRPVAGVRYEARSAAGVLPQSYVSRNEAAAACQAAGKRLCSRAEWMRACRGTAAAPRRDGGRACNHGKAHLLTLLGRGWDYEEDFNDPSLSLTPGFLAATGEHAACRSEVEAYDMVGNVHEWVSDAVTSTFLRAFEAEGVHRQFQYVAVGNAVFMGGFFSTKGELGPGCLFTTVAHDADYHDYSTGFRCCRDASR